MKILDMSAGNRAIWIEKQYPDAIFVDLRQVVRPDIVADTRRLPFADGIFDLVVFDPPHHAFNDRSVMSKTYGAISTVAMKETISVSAIEAARVSKPGALMALKWNDGDYKLGKALELIGRNWLALFGHQVSTKMKRPSRNQWSSTYWIMLLRQATP